MEDDMKTLGVWVGVGAALGAGVALGLASRTRKLAHSPKMVPSFTQPALH